MMFMSFQHHAGMKKANIMLKCIRKFISSSDREALYKAVARRQSGFLCTITTTPIQERRTKIGLVAEEDY